MRKIIISCTTTNARLRFLYYMLESLKRQIVQPDIIYINISKEPYMLDSGIKEIPKWVEDNEKVKINYVVNTGSYRKLVPLFEQDLVSDDDLVITVDDDVLYSEGWLESLVTKSEENPDCIVCCRARNIRKNIMGKYINYSRWNLYGKENKGYDILPTNGAGTVFRKNLVDIDFLVDKKFLSLAPSTDDLWFRIASMRKNIKVAVFPDIDRENIYLQHNEGLCELNFFKSISIIDKVYNKIFGRIIDYIGIPKTKNDKAWRKIYKLSQSSNDLSFQMSSLGIHIETKIK